MGMTSIVIVSYNTYDYTRMCIESIRKYTRPGSYEILVVDNASTDATPAWLREQTDIRCIWNTENTGFPHGCNQGMAAARGADILLLNSDTVVTACWLDNLTRALYSGANIGAVSCMTNCCSNFQKIDVDYADMDEMQRFAAQYNRSDPSRWLRWMTLVGFCFLFKREVYERLGGLDERFSPGNYEDDDYSLRIRMAGYELLLCQDTFIHHFGSASFRNAQLNAEHQKKEQEYRQLSARNKQILCKKWGLSSGYKLLHVTIKALPDQLPAKTRVLLLHGSPMDFFILRESYPDIELAGILRTQVEAELVVGFVATFVQEKVTVASAEWVKAPQDYILVTDWDGMLPGKAAVLERFQNCLTANGKIIYRQQGQLCEAGCLHDSLQVDGEEDLMSTFPMVSVMIPTYNMPKLFQKTLESVLQQDYPNMEILICDNSTNEDTARLMKHYQHDRRIRYIRNRKAKTKEANFASFESLARGEYLQWLMHDDILLPGKIMRMATILRCRPDITLVTSQRGVIDQEGNRIKSPIEVNLPIHDAEYGTFSGHDMGHLILANASNVIGEPSAALFRRKDLKNHYWHADCRGYKTISDVVMWLELLEKGNCVVFKRPLSYYRRHPGQEGQQPDVLLLSRIEWYSLMQEYYCRQVFIQDKDDVLQMFKMFIEESGKLFLKIKQRASSDMRKRYDDCIAEMKQFWLREEERKQTVEIRKYI